MSNIQNGKPFYPFLLSTVAEKARRSIITLADSATGTTQMAMNATEGALALIKAKSDGYDGNPSSVIDFTAETAALNSSIGEAVSACRDAGRALTVPLVD
jgi:hypothetical protein